MNDDDKITDADVGTNPLGMSLILAALAGGTSLLFLGKNNNKPFPALPKAKREHKVCTQSTLNTVNFLALAFFHAPFTSVYHCGSFATNVGMIKFKENSYMTNVGIPERIFYTIVYVNEKILSLTRYPEQKYVINFKEVLFWDNFISRLYEQIYVKAKLIKHFETYLTKDKFNNYVICANFLVHITEDFLFTSYIDENVTLPIVYNNEKYKINDETGKLEKTSSDHKVFLDHVGRIVEKEDKTYVYWAVNSTNKLEKSNFFHLDDCNLKLRNYKQKNFVILTTLKNKFLNFREMQMSTEFSNDCLFTYNPNVVPSYPFVNPRETVLNEPHKKFNIPLKLGLCMRKLNGDINEYSNYLYKYIPKYSLVCDNGKNLFSNKKIKLVNQIDPKSNLDQYSHFSTDKFIFSVHGEEIFHFDPSFDENVQSISGSTFILIFCNILTKEIFSNLLDSVMMENFKSELSKNSNLIGLIICKEVKDDLPKEVIKYNIRKIIKERPLTCFPDHLIEDILIISFRNIKNDRNNFSTHLPLYENSNKNVFIYYPLAFEVTIIPHYQYYLSMIDFGRTFHDFNQNYKKLEHAYIAKYLTLKEKKDEKSKEEKEGSSAVDPKTIKNPSSKGEMPIDKIIPGLEQKGSAVGEPPNGKDEISGGTDNLEGQKGTGQNDAVAGIDDAENTQVHTSAKRRRIDNVIKEMTKDFLNLPEF